MHTQTVHTVCCAARSLRSRAHSWGNLHVRSLHVVLEDRELDAAGRLRREGEEDRAPAALHGRRRLLVPHIGPEELHLEGLQLDPRRAVDERPRRRLALRDEDRVEVPLAAVLVTLLRLLPDATQSATPEIRKFLRLRRASSVRSQANN